MAWETVQLLGFSEGIGRPDLGRLKVESFSDEESWKRLWREHFWKKEPPCSVDFSQKKIVVVTGAVEWRNTLGWVGVKILPGNVLRLKILPVPFRSIFSPPVSTTSSLYFVVPHSSVAHAVWKKKNDQALERWNRVEMRLFDLKLRQHALIRELQAYGVKSKTAVLELSQEEMPRNPFLKITSLQYLETARAIEKWSKENADCKQEVRSRMCGVSLG